MGRTRRCLSVTTAVIALATGLIGAGALTLASPAGADSGDPVSITLGPGSSPNPLPVLFQGSVGDSGNPSSPLQHVELDAIQGVSGGSPQVIASDKTDSSGDFTLSPSLGANGSYALRQKVPPGWTQDAFSTGPGGISVTVPSGSNITVNGSPGSGPNGVSQASRGPTSITNDANIAVTGMATGIQVTDGVPVTLTNNGSIDADHPIAFGVTTGSIGIALPPVVLSDTLSNPAPILTGEAPTLDAGVSSSVTAAQFTVGRYWATSGPAPVASDFTASISWGDGWTTSPATVTGPDEDGNFSIGSTHVFTAGGTFNGSVTVTDTVTGDETTGNFTSTVANPVQPPALTKSFGTASIPLGGQTSLTFKITNPNSSNGLTGVGFTDSLPSGLVVSTPNNGLIGSCSGGTITAAPDSGSLSLSGATLAPSGSCNFSVNVMGVASGTQTNTTGKVTSIEGGSGNAATASLAVTGCPKGATAYLFTGTTKTLPPSTLLGAFCVAKTGQATYQQGTASGTGGVNVNGSSNNFIALGSNMNLGGGTSGPTSQFTEVQPLKATGTYTLTKTG